jgi:hypothetical protein
MKVKRARKILEKLAKNCYRTKCADCVFLNNNGNCLFDRYNPQIIYDTFMQIHKDDIEDAYEDYWGGEGD